MNSDPLWTARVQGHDEALQIDNHPVFARMIASVPPQIRTTFSSVQMAALAHATKPPRANHLIDFRVSVPFLGRRYYVTLLFGKERRSRQRLDAERQLSLRNATITYFVASLLIVSAVLVCAMVFAYVMKSIVGLDLVKAPSIW